MAASVGAYDDGPMGAVAAQAQTNTSEKTRYTKRASSETRLVLGRRGHPRTPADPHGRARPQVGSRARSRDRAPLRGRGRQHHAGPSRAQVHRPDRGRRDRVPLPAVPAARIRVRADPRRADDPPRVRAGGCCRPAAVSSARRRDSADRRQGGRRRRRSPHRRSRRRWCSAAPPTALTRSERRAECSWSAIGHGFSPVPDGRPSGRRRRVSASSIEKRARRSVGLRAHHRCSRRYTGPFSEAR